MSEITANGSRVGITIDHIFYVPAPMLGRPLPRSHVGVSKRLLCQTISTLHREPRAIPQCPSRGKGEKEQKKRQELLCTHKTSSANHGLGYPKANSPHPQHPLIIHITPPSEDLG